jgi:hypothetical protein
LSDKDRVTKDNNPANPQGAASPAAERRRKRIPMSTVDRQLEVDPLPGYHLHWIRASRYGKAIDAGYEPVMEHEVHINNRHSIGTLKAAGGNTDPGSNVSIVADGSTGERLILMKLREEDWREDQDRILQRNVRPMQQIFAGEAIVNPDGTLGRGDGTTYTRPLFNRPPRKIRLMGGSAPNPVGINTRS